MKFLLTTLLVIPCAVFADQHQPVLQTDPQPETVAPSLQGEETPPADMQDGTSPADMQENEVVAEPNDLSMQEELAELHDEAKEAGHQERYVLFVDALKYRVTTHSVEATHHRGKNKTSLNSSSTTTTLRALDATIGLKSYHDRLILGFGISSNLVSSSDAVSGGVLMAGYQLLEGLELGGLLYISNREKTTTTRREDSVDDQLFTSNEDSTTSNRVHSFGPWLKLHAGNYWQALFSAYYTSSRTEQTSDSGQQTAASKDTFNNMTTTVKRSYFALDLIFAPWIPLTERLTFVPQINITCYLPRSYKQTTTMSSSGGDTLAEDTLEFDEHSSLDYSLVLGGLRYEF